MARVRGNGQVAGWRQQAAERLERLLALPMLVLTLAFLVVLVLPVALPDLPPDAQRALDAADMGIWAAFLVEYLARLLVAPSRLSFMLHNPLDLLLVVIPVLRPLRLLRSVRLIRAARLARVGADVGLAARATRIGLASRTALLAAGSAAILVAAAAVMVLDVERAAPKANITGFGDALWWAMSTVTTVGYGDHYPVTAAGRAIGAVLMLAGVGIFGVIAASAAAWFISAERQQPAAPPAQEVSILAAEIAALRHEIRELREQIQAQPPGKRGNHLTHLRQRGSHGNEAEDRGERFIAAFNDIEDEFRRTLSPKRYTKSRTRSRAFRSRSRQSCRRLQGTA
jgi:voltage-gated potassium channel